MSKGMCIVALLLLLPAGSASTQEARSSANRAPRAESGAAVSFDSARIAWESGDYPESLARLESLLQSPDTDEVLEPIALLTGELYRVTEVASDGNTLRWSRDGRVAAYGSGTGAGRRVHLIAVANGAVRKIADVPGFGVALAPAGGEAAYLSVQEFPALRAARAEQDRALAAQDIAAFRRQRSEVLRLESELVRIRVRDLRSGAERSVAISALVPQTLLYGSDGSLYMVATSRGSQGISQIYRVAAGSPPVPVTDAAGLKTNPVAIAGGSLMYAIGTTRFAIRNIANGESRQFEGSSPSVSLDGSAVTFVGKEAGANTISIVRLGAGAQPVVVKRSDRPLANPSLSPDGRRVAYQMMLREDWEVYVADSDGKEEIRLTREIQHDLFPRWLSNDRILAVVGESRHRRSHVYDAGTGERTRLFHNNTVRTVAPEYEWAPSPDGTSVLIVSERDGDTVSPERAVYLVNLAQKVTKAEVLERVRAGGRNEAALRMRGEAMFKPVAEAVRVAVADVSVTRIYGYEAALFGFGSKYITKPGNAMAIEYILNTLRSFGYEPELQWFEPEAGARSANVIATLRGSVNPELVYVISSHFDSVEDGPGADDNSSGTSALLEAARVLAKRPMPATVQFAFFTGEEAGLYGSREYVRRAVANKTRIVGALNNDMVGWANDQRLDNTIRYSNAGIRDLQHAAAFLFTNLITYDAKYYKNTDAHAYYEVYGDIVGGIGSYPILGNPHYHQTHDVLETINHRLVAEVSKTTMASIMLMASSPSRITGLSAKRRGSAVEVAWTAAAESGVKSYVVAHGPPDDPTRTSITVTEPRANLASVGPDAVISVKAMKHGGLESWDWARTEVK
ncbi:MAG: M20/M25/M40 family metallo-hydrolase [Gemmatimonadota bacterium]|nr:M20/M25/M40 family metallo-hydrolase [Gemmatimonadota bacterium]